MYGLASTLVELNRLGHLNRNRLNPPSLYILLSGLSLCHHLGNPLEHLDIYPVGFFLQNTLMLTLLAEILARSLLRSLSRSS